MPFAFGGFFGFFFLSGFSVSAFVFSVIFLVVVSCVGTTKSIFSVVVVDDVGVGGVTNFELVRDNSGTGSSSFAGVSGFKGGIPWVESP